MHWQEACVKSRCRVAVRKTKDGRIVYHYWNGTGLIEHHRKGTFRDAFREELEGYFDWQPMDGE